MTTPASDHQGSDRGDSPMYRAALEYARRGWSLVALHWITAAGQCSCGRPGCKSAGKHPRDKDWQHARSTTGLPDRWRGGNAENIGIRTGRASGFWVLDFDPADTLTLAGRDLFDRLVDGGFYPHVTTGGGGSHFRFALPDDGREIRNLQSAGGGYGRTHSLPMGWDVRGEGGQVVAPPSVSAKGAYVELIEGDAEGPPPPYVPPAWLLEMVAPPDRMVSLDQPPAPLPSGGLVADARIQAEGSSHPAVRVQAYAAGALATECEEYSRLTDGRRGEAAAAFARSLVEIANLAGWSVVEGGEVYGWFESALATAAANGGGGGYGAHEVAGQWARAVEHVAGRSRMMPDAIEVLPAPPLEQTLTGQQNLEVSLSDFVIVEPGAPYGGHGSTNGSAPRAGANGQPAVMATTPAPSGPPPAPPVGWTRGQYDAYWRIRNQEWAKAQIEREKFGDRAAAVARMRAEIIDTVGVKALPRLQPIIPGLFYRNSLARIIGSSGHGKSFVVLDLAARVGAGMSWAGRPAIKGSVLWLVAEGVEGVADRIEAWEVLNERPVENVTYLPRPVNALGAEWDVFCEALAGLGHEMIFLDTQARITPGAGELDRAEQSELVEACDRLKTATGACVVLVHHRGQQGTHARGHTEVFGALQTQVYVEKSGNRITVGARQANGGKTKDDREPTDIVFQLVDVPIVGRPDENGIVDPGREKGALRWLDGATSEDGEEKKETATEKRMRWLWTHILNTYNKGEGATRETIRAAFNDHWFGGKKDSTSRMAWSNTWQGLISLGLVAKRERGDYFKVIVREDQSAAGVLTPDHDQKGEVPEGFNAWTFVQEKKESGK